MSQESISHNPAKIAEALGANYCLRVGSINIADVLSGTAARLADYAQVLHKNAQKIKEPKNILEKNIVRIYNALGPDSTVELDNHQARHALFAGNSLITINNSHEEGAPLEQTVRRLFDLYFEHQTALTETALGHWLRVAGDDFAVDTGFDLDRTWDLYQEALKDHERRK